MKRIVSIILSLALLCSFLAMPTFAAAAYNNDVTVSATLSKSELIVSSSAQTVVLYVNASKSVDLFSIGYQVSVPAGWEITSITSGSNDIVYSLDDNHYNLSTGVVSWYKATNKTASSIGVITVSIPANTPAGPYQIGVSGVELATEGQNNDNAWMSDGSASAWLTIKEPAVLTGISVTTAPTKVDYIAGQNFAPAGMVVTAAYSDSSTKTVTGWTVADGTSLTAGKTSVTISYTEDGVTKTTTQEITVAAKALTGISVKTAPTKTRYIVGQDFDSAGMVIEATYNDNSKQIVDGWTVTNGLNLTTEVSSVTISYTEGEVTKTTTQAIKVTAKDEEDDPQEATDENPPAPIEKSCPKDYTCPMAAFSDLDMTQWYHDGIHYCLAEGLMNGIGDGLFNPEGTTTRAMIVTILWRIEGKPAANYTMSFKDVPANEWYTEAIRWARAYAIVDGYSAEEFGPDDAITREQLATILYNYAKYKGEGFRGAWYFPLDFVDTADINAWANEAVHWCSMNGIVNGKDGKVFDPQGAATRAQVAAMIQRFCENILR